jgi:hypothetical protein
VSSRTDIPSDLVLETELSPEECLAATEYVARQARSFGIPRRLEVRRSPTGVADDRHQVTCRHGAKISWVMVLDITRAADDVTLVVLRLDRYRRRPGGMADGEAAQAYVDLVSQALQVARLPRRAVEGNVIPLHPYALLGRLAS